MIRVHAAVERSIRIAVVEASSEGATERSNQQARVWYVLFTAEL